ncbi:MAG TPA: hypothetical protein VGT05_01480 [Patescibacteria group bacterium]|nr:hypothetical protein [Patescibacteria group bacterium]
MKRKKVAKKKTISHRKKADQVFYKRFFIASFTLAVVILLNFAFLQFQQSHQTQQVAGASTTQ